MSDERLNLKDEWTIVGNYTNCYDCNRKIIAANLQIPNGGTIMHDPRWDVCPDCQIARNKKIHEQLLGKGADNELAQNAQE